MLLFRGVDIGAELFAMAVSCARAQMMVRTARPHAAEAVELADLFCRMARRRIQLSFQMMSKNEDIETYRTARRVLDGKHEWLEEGIVADQPVELPADDWAGGAIQQMETSTTALS